jgi:hypothetical protein
VRLEAVGDTLHRLNVPKYVVAYLLNISSVDVKNISALEVSTKLEVEKVDPTQAG